MSPSVWVRSRAGVPAAGAFQRALGVNQASSWLLLRALTGGWAPFPVTSVGLTRVPLLPQTSLHLDRGTQ